MASSSTAAAAAVCVVVSVISPALSVVLQSALQAEGGINAMSIRPPPVLDAAARALGDPRTDSTDRPAGEGTTRGTSSRVESQQQPVAATCRPGAEAFLAELVSPPTAGHGSDCGGGVLVIDCILLAAVLYQARLTTLVVTIDEVSTLRACVKGGESGGCQLLFFHPLHLPRTRCQLADFQIMRLPPRLLHPPSLQGLQVPRRFVVVPVGTYQSRDVLRAAVAASAMSTDDATALEARFVPKPLKFGWPGCLLASRVRAAATAAADTAATASSGEEEQSRSETAGAAVGGSLRAEEEPASPPVAEAAARGGFYAPDQQPPIFSPRALPTSPPTSPPPPPFAPTTPPQSTSRPQLPFWEGEDPQRPLAAYSILVRGCAPPSVRSEGTNRQY